jgi:hypothetical protein
MKLRLTELVKREALPFTSRHEEFHITYHLEVLWSVMMTSTQPQQLNP